MTLNRISTFFLIILVPVLVFSQVPAFNADSAYAYIEHMTVTIGPRPVGSLNERLALDWTVEKFKHFGADSAFVMEFKKAETRGVLFNTQSGVAVGIFRGVTDSSIVVGGHIDSDAAEIPGANDNASGTASVIELARIWSQRPRHYTMIFTAFGGEERGLFGSKHFVDHFRGIDKVALMLQLDMTGSDDNIVTIAETDSLQAPEWLIRDAFKMDKELGINRLQYPTHFSTINDVLKAAGSDHESFLDKHIPAMDFTAGVNNSPIHTPQDNIIIIKKPMLDNCGRLVDGLLTKYQEQGIPAANGGRYMLWNIFGYLLFLPLWLITTFNIICILLAVWTFIYSYRHRLRIEKERRVRFSGLKLLLMMFIIAICAQLGEALIQFISGLRYPWYIHVYPYLWLVAIGALVGLWLVLQLTYKWRFSSDPYVYALRAVIILFIVVMIFCLLSMRLALYPALTLTLICLAVLISDRRIKFILVVIAPLPMIRLMFMEVFQFIARGSAYMGFAIDNFPQALLYSAVLTAIIVIWYIPMLFSWSYIIAALNAVKSVFKYSRKPVFGIIALLVMIGYSSYLFTLPAYDELWRPSVQVNAEYTMNEDKNKLRLAGNEYFHDVTVVSDTLNQNYSGGTHREELPITFTADWINLSGSETVAHGDKDTVNVDWLICSDHPWYRITLTVQVDTLDIYDVHSDLNFNHRKDKVIFYWYTEQSESLQVAARFTVEPGAMLIRRVSTRYYEMPVPIDVSCELANVRYRTTVMQTDTLDLITSGKSIN